MDNKPLLGDVVVPESDQSELVSSHLTTPLACLILTSGARYKDALWLKMVLFIFKNDLLIGIKFGGIKWIRLTKIQVLWV